MHFQPFQPFRFLSAFLIGCLVAASSQAGTPETHEQKRRCGWFHNPTPGNAWLVDSEREWVISTQGNEGAEGAWPSFNTEDKRQWRITNSGSYGYGCACMSMIADKDGQVLRIAGAKARPISACASDQKLPSPTTN